MLHALDLLLLLPLTDQAPEPEDVKAGWTAFFIFLGLIAAVVLLGFSLTKQLRKAQAAEDAGVYGDRPATTGPTQPTQPTQPEAPADATEQPAPTDDAPADEQQP